MTVNVNMATGVEYDLIRALGGKELLNMSRRLLCRLLCDREAITLHKGKHRFEHADAEKLTQRLTTSS